MNLLLGNPWGLLALLGIPALVAIHFLQRKARKIPSSTLFLLERTHRESKAGSKFERFVPSLPFWLQLLGVLLLVWLLAEPRFIRPNSVQRIGIVFDSSASMRASMERYETTLKENVSKLQGSASAIELFAIESDTTLPTIYRGDNLEELLKSLENRKPSLGTHDFKPALRIARNLIGSEGSLVFLTDEVHERLPFNAALLAVGEKVDNVGITGIDIIKQDGTKIWRAIIRNYGETSQTRTWTVIAPNGEESSPRSLNIKAGSLTSVQGPFARGNSTSQYCILCLENDAFDLDDSYPLIIPKKKSLSTYVQASERYTALTNKLITGFESLKLNVELESADLALVSYDPLNPELPNKDSIVFLDESGADSDFLAGGIITASHPLVAGVNWQPLIIRDSIRLESEENDIVLLWQEKQPLIILRESSAFVPSDESSLTTQKSKQLIFNFDLALSNALKLPATAVLLHRFLETLRREKPSEESLQLETNQSINIALLERENSPVSIKTLNIETGKTTIETLTGEKSLSYKTPATPSYIEIVQNDTLLLKAAVSFADSREASFSKAETKNSLDSLNSSAVELHSDKDSLWRVWILLTVALFLITWHIILRRKNPSTNSKSSTESAPSYS